MTNSYYVNIVARLLFIVLVGVAIGWLANNGSKVYNIIALAILLVFLVASLFGYINGVNKRIAYFFNSVHNDDFSLSFPKYSGNSLLAQLSASLQRVNQQIQQVKIESQRQEHYFAALIENVETGILSINADGFIVHANGCVKRMVGLQQFSHIRQLQRVDTELADAVANLQPNHERLVTLNGKGGRVTLLVKASSFVSGNQSLKLLSLHDIKKELDEKELESWLKLIRVLTHEIMNSIAPVTSLSESLCGQFVRDGVPVEAAAVDEKLIARTIQGLQVIREQGEGLVRFVDSYRKLTRLPLPEKTDVNLKDFIEKTVILFKSYLPYSNITIAYTLQEPSMQVCMDEMQVSQVLINLLKNAAEALTEASNPQIRIDCRYNARGQVEVDVIDNGTGIPAELLSEIFIPFFTTRENGSGIGLSLSRQIMRMHGGSLVINSHNVGNTCFTLRLG